MIRKIYIAALGVVMGLNSLAQGADAKDLQLNTITTAVPFLQITPDSRSGAMGDAGTAMSPSFASFFWNTSMLSFSEKESEIGVAYTPWLQSITNDINLSYLAGYKRLNSRSTVGGSLRFFSLGDITFTDAQGTVTRNHTPTEFELLGGYSFKLNDKFSLGLNGKFIFSNLTAGITVAGAQTKAGLAGATDVSFSYFNKDAKFGSTKGSYAFGATINNIGNKISYTTTNENERDFLPTSLKIGNALTFDIDSYNKVTWSTDVNKLLIPTPPNVRFNPSTNEYEILSGKNPNVGVISGALQSFSDAPGTLVTDSNGEPVKGADGNYQVVKGSKFKEELAEITIGTGVEYWYNDLFAVRGGYFYEHHSKGARQYATLGVGIKYNVFLIDFSYLANAQITRFKGTQGVKSPLANTVRFSLRFQFGNKSNTESVKPE